METGVSGWMRNHSCNTHTFNNPYARSWRKRMWFAFWPFRIWWKLIWSQSAAVTIHHKPSDDCSFSCRPHPPFCFFTFPILTSAFQSVGLQQVSSVGYRHEGCRPSCEVTSLRGMFHVRGERGVPTHKDWPHLRQISAACPAYVLCFIEVHTAPACILTYCVFSFT